MTRKQNTWNAQNVNCGQNIFPAHGPTHNSLWGREENGHLDYSKTMRLRL